MIDLDAVTVAELERDPYPIYARLRDEAPVAYMPCLDIWMVTRWGACRSIQLGLICTIIALAISLIATLPALALASVLLGLAMCIMTPAAAHVLFRFSPPRRRNLVFSVKQTCVPAGWMFMALIAPPVTTNVSSDRSNEAKSRLPAACVSVESRTTLLANCTEPVAAWLTL